VSCAMEERTKNSVSDVDPRVEQALQFLSYFTQAERRQVIVALQKWLDDTIPSDQRITRHEFWTDPTKGAPASLTDIDCNDTFFNLMEKQIVPNPSLKRQLLEGLTRY
jgi:hypothetical protein